MNLREKFKFYNAQTSPSPLLLEFTAAQGIYLINAQGKKFIDFISGIGVSSWGHGNDAVIDAIKRQSELYLHQMVYGEYVQAPQVVLAEQLVKLLPDKFQQVYFVTSGAEAVEGALKTAVRFTGRSRIAAARNAYHGSTTGALSLMSSEYFTLPYNALRNSNVDFFDFNNSESLHCITEETACAIVEVVQGEAGYIPARIEFLNQLRQRCDDTGTLLLFDEIQSGMGRTGTWFAFQQYEVQPDILLLAKALGAGMPLGAFISSTQIMQCLSDNPVLGHITTYGGHPVSCAAALAGINFAQHQNIIADVLHKETLIRETLAEYEISGKGLMLGIHCPSIEHCKTAIEAMLNEGLITDWFLHAPHKIRLAPPLTISDDELKTALLILKKHLPPL